MAVSDPRAARLALALGEAGLALSCDGRIAVFGPRAGDDLSMLDRARVHIIQGFRPDHDAFAAAGWTTGVAPDGRYAAVLVCLPRAKAAARDLIAQAAEVTDGQLIVDGQKSEGIDSLLRESRARADVSAPVSKGHGKLYWMATPGAAFADWRAVPQQVEGGFVTLPGVFSADGPDPGSRLLAEALPGRIGARLADPGAGWGWLAAQLLEHDGVEEVHLIEADHAALECARRNISDSRARFHWADATRFRPDEPFDAVVMNPPFHTERAATPELGVDFIASAARMLAPQGTLWMVANRSLPYERALGAAFRDIAELAGDGRFKLFRAARPRPPSGARKRG